MRLQKILVYFLPHKNPYQNLALEEFFLTQKEKKKEEAYLLFYENIFSIIHSKFHKKEEEIRLSLWKRYPIPVVPRSSGGSAVLHFLGNLNFSLFVSLEIFPQWFSVANSYCEILDMLREALYSFLPYPIKHQGVSDIAFFFQGKWIKISGNSQRRTRGWLMHHGTIIYRSIPLSYFERYLLLPKNLPHYRKNRAHKDFLPFSLYFPPQKFIHFFLKTLEKKLSSPIFLKEISPLWIKKASKKISNLIL